MKPEAVFLFGLPGSGKTTWYKENKSQLFRRHVYINADEIKEEFEDYDETVVGMYSKEAIQKAKSAVLDTIAEKKSFVMDAGGINTNYTIGLLEEASKRKYNVTLYNIDTPYWECVERNKNRSRVVPEQLILDKEVKRTWQWERLISSGFVTRHYTIPFFNRKYLFFDMDGVLAAQIGLPEVNGEIDFVNSRYFTYLPVVEQVRDKLIKLQKDGREVFILSATPTSFSADEKKDWLRQHFPSIPEQNIFFVSQGRYKAEMFRDLSKRLKLGRKNMCLIEDTHSIIKTIKRTYKMDAVHVSEFLTKRFK